MMSGPVSPPWPAAQEQTIIDSAVKFGVTAAVDTVNQIKNWLGHPDRVIAATRQWSPVATGHIAQSATDLNTATTNLETYWEGHARDAFSDFSASLLSSIDSTGFPLRLVAGALTDSLNVIKEAYKAGVDLIANVATTILEAGKSLPDIVGGVAGIVGGVLTRDPKAVGSGVSTLLGGATVAIISLLQGFVATARDLAKSYTEILTTTTQTMLRLESVESTLRVPDAAPIALGEPGLWRVHPAPRSNNVEFPELTEPPQGPGSDNNGTPPPATGTPAPEGGSPGPGDGGSGSGSSGGSDSGGGSGGGRQDPKPPGPDGSSHRELEPGVGIAPGFGGPN